MSITWAATVMLAAPRWLLRRSATAALVEGAPADGRFLSFRWIGQRDVAEEPCKSMAGILARLERRRLLAAATHRDLGAVLRPRSAQQAPAVYLGVDPTADGLHVGHLAGVRALRLFQEEGFRPIALVGGATGLIGDPSGRDAERDLLSPDRVAENVAGLRRDLGNLLEFGADGPTSAVVVNNLDWTQGMSALDLLRDVGKHFRVNTMLSRDSVKSRLGGAGEGLSFTEFSYQLLQAYDFLHLYRTMGCQVQLGGSDQFGNIVGGLDLIRRAEGKTDAAGVTIPLLTTRSGQKIGKSAGNAVWLDPSKTSDYAFYQYFLRTDDGDLETLLHCLTDLEEDDVAQVLGDHAAAPGKRVGQASLADGVTRLVRGEDRLARAKAATAALFGGGVFGGLRAADLLDAAASGDVPLVELSLAEAQGKPVVELALAAGAVKSKGEARRLVKAHGLYLGGRRVEAANATFDAATDALEGQVALLRTGKRNYHLVKLTAP